jgi:hypothetical protein
MIGECLILLVPPAGLEPAAPRLGISCSIRLSYGGSGTYETLLVHNISAESVSTATLQERGVQLPGVWLTRRTPHPFVESVNAN